MRVLWLCNIMLPMIAEQLHREASNKEGWLSGLAETCLRHRDENDITLALAFPMTEDLVDAEQYGAERHLYDGNVIYQGTLEKSFADQDAESALESATESAAKSVLHWFAFKEDTVNPHLYDENLELSLYYIVKEFHPDVVHCFGTEYPHTLAMCRVMPDKNRILIGIQGLCKVYADAYFADLPRKVIQSATLRDVLKKDGLREQQNKFVLRGEMEQEAITLAGNVTGRTAWDKHYTRLWNPNARYYKMNETLRASFYKEQWRPENCEPHSIFLSQGDYPIKGLHYMLLALSAIRKEFPDVKVYVAGNSIIGDTSVMKRLKISAYGKYLRELIRRENLWGQISFLGRLSAEQMKQQYLKSNLFVCCSSIENSPNSLGEAMLLGMPCVSADVGGISSIFTDGEDGILYPGFRIAGEREISGDESSVGAGFSGNAGRTENAGSIESTGLTGNAENLAEAVIRMFRETERQKGYAKNAREHALKTHDPQANYERLLEIYNEIVLRETALHEGVPKFVFVSNYINHHQIPFCNAMYERLGEKFAFIQTEPMEEERVRMGWQQVKLPYVRYYYENSKECQALIDEAETVFFGGTDEEKYIQTRLQSGRLVMRYSERLYKEGQWKAVSPRGLLKKYHDHTRYRNAPVYLLCAGAYVPSDFHIVRSYPGKMYRWGYFPETKRYEIESLLRNKKQGSILWAARFLDWKHPELPLLCAKYLKEKGCNFHMNLVGGGQMQPLVDQLMAQYELADVVTLLGYQTPEAVRGLMEQSDIFLATSDRKEGWGAVINEAMNSGCAVVADHMMGAVPYLIKPGENGCVYQDGRPMQLYAQVERLLSDRELCRKLGREAYRTITEEWNAEQAAARLLNLTQNILTGQGSSAEADSGPCSAAEVISERSMLCKMQQRQLADR